MSLLDKLDKFDSQEAKKPKKISEEISPEVERLDEIQKYIPKQPKTAKEYQPHGTDIMTSYKLIVGKSIRKYKGKGTNKALLDGLIQAYLNLKSKLKE
ncbi:MAG: hypothetical protein ACTSXH_12245 [Promethearchaeota archaeon]